MAKSILTRAAGTVALLTVVSNVLGFFRETSLAAVFGATAETDAFLMAQTIPYLVFAMISYALTTTFIPVFSQIREESGSGAAFQFAGAVMSSVVLLTIVFVGVGELFADRLVALVAPGFDGYVAQLTTSLTRIVLPMMAFQLLTGVMTGMLQSSGQFSVPMIAAVVQNACLIVAIVVIGPRYGIAAVASGAVLGSALSLLVMVPAVRRMGFRWFISIDVRNPALRRMFRLMLPGIVGAGAAQLYTLVDRMLASGLSEGRVAALSYAERLTHLAPAVIGTSIVTVIYPAFAKLAARRDWDGLGGALVSALNLIYFLLAPIAAGVVVLREPLVRVVFQRGVFDVEATTQTAWALLFLGVGIGIGVMYELVARVFFALQDTKTPMIVSVVTVVANIGLNLAFIRPLEQGGLALATTLSTLLALALALYVLVRTFPAGLTLGPLISSASRSLLASVLMGLGVWLLYPQLEFLMKGNSWSLELARLVVIVSFGAGVYFALARTFRIPEFEMAMGFFGRRIGIERR